VEVKHSYDTYTHAVRHTQTLKFTESIFKYETYETINHHFSLFLTYDADDEGEQVNDAMKQLHVSLCLVTKYSVDQDG